MKNKNKKSTELVFLLDRSGSMHGLEKDTIGGFNAMIEKQKKQEGQVFVSTVLFNHESKVVHDRVSLEQIAPMTEQDYTVGGCTALLDALGDAVRHIRNIHKYAREEDIPEHTLFVVTTDGMENASQRYDLGKVRALIEHQKEKYRWEFIFIGANIDALETARSFGIDESRAVNYRADEKGTRNVYETVSKAVFMMREDSALAPSWKEPIEQDYESRKE